MHRYRLENGEEIDSITTEMTKVTKPDFRQWAYNVTIRLNTQERTQDRIEAALRQAFEQGYQLGLNKGWSIEQEKDYTGS